MLITAQPAIAALLMFPVGRSVAHSLFCAREALHAFALGLAGPRFRIPSSSISSAYHHATSADRHFCFVDCVAAPVLHRWGIPPWVGAGKSAAQVITGRDLVTDEEVSRWGEAGGVLLGLVPGGKLLTKGKKALGLAKSAEKAKETADFAVRFHHAFPQYLGGKFQQLLEPLPKELHDAYHSGLDKVLPRQAGGAYYEGLTAAARSQMLRDLATYTKFFDAKYGTKLYDAMIREGLQKLP